MTAASRISSLNSVHRPCLLVRQFGRELALILHTKLSLMDSSSSPRTPPRVSYNGNHPSITPEDIPDKTTSPLVLSFPPFSLTDKLLSLTRKQY
eukprot:scaffold327_cov189-Alexandrium_tamarense.AAC.24